MRIIKVSAVSGLRIVDIIWRMIIFIRILKGVNCYAFDTDWYFKSFIETYAAIDVCPEKKETKHCFFLFLVACLAARGLFMCGVRASERVAWRQKLSSSRRFQIYLILSVLCALLSLVTAFFWLLCMYAITDSLDFALLGVILWHALWQALALMVWTIFACLAHIWELDACSLTQNWIDSGTAARTLMIS